MYCPNCGKEIPDGRELCKYCGTRFENIFHSTDQQQTIKIKSRINEAMSFITTFGVLIILCVVAIFSFLPMVNFGFLEGKQTYNFFDLMSEEEFQFVKVDLNWIGILWIIGLVIAILGVMFYCFRNVFLIKMYLPKKLIGISSLLAYSFMIFVLVCTFIFMNVNISDLFSDLFAQDEYDALSVVSLIIFFVIIPIFILLGMRSMDKYYPSRHKTENRILALSTLLSVLEIIIFSVILILLCSANSKLFDYGLGALRTGFATVIIIVILVIFIAVIIAAMVIKTYTYYTTQEIQDREESITKETSVFLKIPTKNIITLAIIMSLVGVLIHFRTTDYFIHIRQVDKIEIGMGNTEIRDLIGNPISDFNSNTWEYYCGAFESKYKKYLSEVEKNDSTESKLAAYQKIAGDKHVYTRIVQKDGVVVEIFHDKNRIYDEVNKDINKKTIEDVHLYDAENNLVTSIKQLNYDDQTDWKDNLNSCYYEANFKSGGFIKACLFEQSNTQRTANGYKITWTTQVGEFELYLSE